MGKLPIPRNWTFDRPEVAAGFDAHVREQLPWYDLVTGAVAHIARHYMPQGGRVYDIGASTGNLGRALAADLAERGCVFVPVEKSRAMAARYDGPGQVRIADAARFDYKPFDLALCFLTLMFLTVEARAGLLTRLRARLRPGGAILVLDKLEAGTGYPATVLWRLTLAGKMAEGADAGEIIAKELSLGGVQRPLSPAELGPGAVQFFRFADFAGWIIEAGAGGTRRR